MKRDFLKGGSITPRILIVDDDQVLRSEFMDTFEEYGVIEAPDGEEALRILKKANEIDLVMLDVRMSGLNGIEVLNRIRKTSPGVRVVIFTGYGSKDVIVEALRGQADDYIEKPLDVEATREVIEKFLANKKGRPDSDAMDIKTKLEHVKEFIKRNVLKKITLKDAAAAVYLSPKYLSRIFKEQTGEGFNEFKFAVKTEEAKNLLLNTGYNINQISDKLGYENPESFIRQFKKITKKTPTEFRRAKTKRSV
jgi:YesN/AraC family two-component response regulator